ncbi:bifunctional UDP-N-acetylglucosamine pyrophosphorylase/glucosamine-1-phosphate N-acetyltransferase [Kribbella sp. VKM Ac-2527]|uniref:Bifunctional UDP-N-acetylglucosamine pyrophosphorylase/glucosamine-1-phosphate N-acetyltransferase n=1 Tax=Kribbella caucasensis TaxID=2512215 RepID=A0A4R6IUX3_9ACTN|nr:hypothetical protein [Kribbella sp. VKM Ac-2527]TDO26141.1 bifunctional UDP-N-acetylglucosamine pyrophosphorylase/glucosamine-1-phosphate N-acetyltransferase [Kribbella sp. VKM Ac-2527]
MLKPEHYFDSAEGELRYIFELASSIWDVIPRLTQIVDEMLAGKRIIKGFVSPDAYLPDGPIYIGEGASIEAGACLTGPTYVGPGATIRHGAYARTPCVLLEGSLLGHASEAKNSLLLASAKAAHFAYVGDSILGRDVNLGAGTKLSNVKISAPHENIILDFGGERIDTGLRKFGAILGDGIQIGCNAVLSPGTLVGPRSRIYPGVVLRKGFYPSDTIIKLRQQIESVEAT